MSSAVGGCLPTAFALIFNVGGESSNHSLVIDNLTGDMSYVPGDKITGCVKGVAAIDVALRRLAGVPSSSSSPPLSVIGYRDAGSGDVWNVTASAAAGVDAMVNGMQTTESVADDDFDFRRRCLIGSVLTLFALFTVAGNALVMAAVACEPCLRATVTNYFVVSLAVADLIIGAVVMPFGIVIEATGGWWPFGVDWCDVWHSFDVLASTASILNLSVIALDRYWAITDPIAYPGRMSTARAFVFIGLVWVCSAAISFPAIAWWRHSAAASATATIPAPAIDDVAVRSLGSDKTSFGVRQEPVAMTTTRTSEPVSPESCQFTEDSGYLIFSSLISFYGPVSVILFAYYRIYAAAAAQLRSLERGSKVLTTTDGVSVTNGSSGVMTLRIHRGGGGSSSGGGVGGAGTGRRLAGARAPSLGSDNIFGDSDPSQHSRDLSARRLTCASAGGSGSSNHQQHDGCGSVRQGASSTSSSTTSRRRWNTLTVCRRRLGRVARERKAAKTLGIVMGVFCACWVPFFVTNLLYGVCNHVGCVRNADVLFSVFTWLGYVNSGMNPVIYACSMRDFRRAFGRLLCRRSCRRHSFNVAAHSRGVAVYRRSTGGVSLSHQQLRRTIHGRPVDNEYSSTSFIY
jgi:dopamine D1-like receptor